MAYFRYVKKIPRKKVSLPVFIPYVFTLSGLFVLLWVIWPIAKFQVTTALSFSRIVSPLAEIITDRTVSPVVLASSDSKRGGYANLMNLDEWYPNQPQKRIVTPVNSYTLSIPVLKITNAAVTIAGDSLEKSLIHYGGTGIPGEYGNAVIFGHSTLPALFNASDYKTIFALLPTLKYDKPGQKGDEIYITYDGFTYKYRVINMTVTEPNDLTPLAQRYDDSYITLVTCVPPGTYWKRLYVLAKMVQE